MQPKNICLAWVMPLVYYHHSNTDKFRDQIQELRSENSELRGIRKASEASGKLGREKPLSHSRDKY